jgi:hypothetical protein
MAARRDVTDPHHADDDCAIEPPIAGPSDHASWGASCLCGVPGVFVTGCAQFVEERARSSALVTKP